MYINGKCAEIFDAKGIYSMLCKTLHLKWNHRKKFLFKC